MLDELLHCGATQLRRSRKRADKWTGRSHELSVYNVSERRWEVENAGVARHVEKDDMDWRKEVEL